MNLLPTDIDSLNKVLDNNEIIDEKGYFYTSKYKKFIEYFINIFFTSISAIDC